MHKKNSIMYTTELRQTKQNKIYAMTTKTAERYKILLTRLLKMFIHCRIKEELCWCLAAYERLTLDPFAPKLRCCSLGYRTNIMYNNTDNAI